VILLGKRASIPCSSGRCIPSSCITRWTTRKTNHRRHRSRHCLRCKRRQRSPVAKRRWLILIRSAAFSSFPRRPSQGLSSRRLSWTLNRRHLFNHHRPKPSLRRQLPLPHLRHQSLLLLLHHRTVPSARPLPKQPRPPTQGLRPHLRPLHRRHFSPNPF